MIRDRAENATGGSAGNLKVAASNLKLPPSAAPMGLPKSSLSSQNLAQPSFGSSQNLANPRLNSNPNLSGQTQSSTPSSTDWAFGAGTAPTSRIASGTSQAGFASFDPFPAFGPAATPVNPIGQSNAHSSFPSHGPFYHCLELFLLKAGCSGEVLVWLKAVAEEFTGKDLRYRMYNY